LSLSEQTLPKARGDYNRLNAEYGIEHVDSFDAGAKLANILLQAGHMIEAERLLKKFIVSPGRVFGPEHPQTTELDQVMHGVKLCQVLMYSVDKELERWKFHTTVIMYSLLLGLWQNIQSIMMTQLAIAINLNGKIGEV
jgi:hypothetical protein